MPDPLLLLHAGALGDLVLSLHVTLRMSHDSDGIDVVARTCPGDLSTCQPAIRWQSSEGRGLHWLHGDQDRPPPAVLRDLLCGRRVLSALGGPQTIVHQRLSELAARVYSFDPPPSPGLSRHITQLWQTQLEGQGLLVPKCFHQRPTQRSLGVSPALTERGRRLILQLTGTSDAIVMSPGSGGRHKCWPSDAFVAVAKRLRTASPTLFVLGPVEEEKWPSDVISALEGAAPVLRSPDPDDLVALLAAARAYVGNDSGVSHLAGLFGVRTVVLFGPTSAAVWHPLGPRVTVLNGDPAADPAWGLRIEDVCAAVLE